jgi:hypothetical protein
VSAVLGELEEGENDASRDCEAVAMTVGLLATSRLPGTDPHGAHLGLLPYSRHSPGISVSLQVEHKQFIGNGHLIGSSLR